MRDPKTGEYENGGNPVKTGGRLDARPTVRRGLHGEVLEGPGAALGLSDRSGRSTPQNGMDAWKKRMDNIAKARADGTFNPKRDDYNRNNTGSWMDTNGVIGARAPGNMEGLTGSTGAPNGKLVEYSGGHRWVPNAPSATASGAAATVTPPMSGPAPAAQTNVLNAMGRFSQLMGFQPGASLAAAAADPKNQPAMQQAQFAANSKASAERQAAAKKKIADIYGNGSNPAPAGPASSSPATAPAMPDERQKAMDRAREFEQQANSMRVPDGSLDLKPGEKPTPEMIAKAEEAARKRRALTDEANRLRVTNETTSTPMSGPGLPTFEQRIASLQQAALTARDADYTMPKTATALPPGYDRNVWKKAA
jgi:hypothetical protein